MADDQNLLVSTDWLFQNLDNPKVKILDGSWYLPAMERGARAEYSQAHIPGAQYFDIDAVSDKASALPHMVPTGKDFAAAVSALGISDGDQVVVYDGMGLFSAARVWWLFRYMGFEHIAVLDGGLPKWKTEDRPLEGEKMAVTPGSITASPNPSMLRSVAQVLDAVQTAAPQILDARAADRFRGEAAEPRPGMRSGHMPGALNLPFGQVLENGSLASPDTLQTVFEGAGVDLNKPIITSCGSGVTAAVLTLALTKLGHKDVALYDGSWSEWGADPALPIATGEN